MNSSTDTPGLQEDLDWVSDAYDETISRRCAEMLSKEPDLRDKYDIAELAWTVATQDSRPELRYNPECASHPPIPRRNFSEWIRDLFRRHS